MEGLSDPKERASIRRGRAAVRPAATAGLGPPALAPKTRARTSAVRRDARHRCQTHANGAIIRALRTNIVQRALDLLCNCLICGVRRLARTLQCHTTPPASHLKPIGISAASSTPFPEAI